MSTKVAKDLARKARKIAPANLYDFARNIEKAIEALSDEIEVLKQAGAQDSFRPAKGRAKWAKSEN